MHDNLFKPLNMGVCTIRYSLWAKLANKTFILNHSDLEKLNQEKKKKKKIFHILGVWNSVNFVNKQPNILLGEIISVLKVIKAKSH